MEAILNYIRPELIILIPALYLLGIALKKARTVADRYIPLLLGGAGVLLAVLWVLASSEFTGWQSVLMGLFVAVTQGILCAGGAVYVNQAAVKQPGRGEKDE